MNDLETVISKVVSAREMIDVANEALEYNQKERAEKLTMAAYEFLGYFIEEFDEKFKDAWEATVGDLREGDVREDLHMPPWGHSDLEYASKKPVIFKCDGGDKTPECQNAWNDFWEEDHFARDIATYSGEFIPEKHTDKELNVMHNNAEKKDKVKKWILPVEMDGLSGEYFINLPDEILEKVKWEEGDELMWIDKNDGSFELRKVTKQRTTGEY